MRELPPPSRARMGCNNGLLFSLPEDLVFKVMQSCSLRELASLDATCKQTLVQDHAKGILTNSPRAHGCLEPSQGENWISLLKYMECQAMANAQGTALALGGYHTLALVSSTSNARGFSLASCGLGKQGQLGNGTFRQSCHTLKCILGNDDTDSLEPYIPDNEADLGEPGDDIVAREEMQDIRRYAYPASLSAGSGHSLMIAYSGSVYSYGFSHYGVLGLNSFAVSEASPKRMVNNDRVRTASVSAGTTHSLALTEHGKVLACGSNSGGQIGHSLDRPQPVLVLSQVPLEEPYEFAAVAAGESHSVALTEKGKVWTWGSGSQGQLGHELIAGRLREQPGLPLDAHLPRPLGQFDPGECPLQDRATCISAGGNQTAVVTVKGRLAVFGSNKNGCLGTGTTEPILTPFEVNLQHLTSGTGSLYRVIQACCGKTHMVILVLCENKMLVCSSGDNCYGQLGLGDWEDRKMFTVVEALEGKQVISIAAGNDHSAAITQDGEIFMWGRNDSGQLGLGHYDHTSVPKAIQEVRLAPPQTTLGGRPSHE